MIAPKKSRRTTAGPNVIGTDAAEYCGKRILSRLARAGSQLINRAQIDEEALILRVAGGPGFEVVKKSTTLD